MEKVSLPIKTKIAVWYIRILGFILIGLGVIGGIPLFSICTMSLKGCLIFLLLLFPFIPPFILGGLLLTFLGSYILKKRKKAWWANTITFSTGIVSCVLGFIYYKAKEFFSPDFELVVFVIFTLLLVPLVLLLLDRKNFWKIAI